jgi:hypothetical protein
VFQPLFLPEELLDDSIVVRNRNLGGRTGPRVHAFSITRPWGGCAQRRFRGRNGEKRETAAFSKYLNRALGPGSLGWVWGSLEAAMDCERIGKGCIGSAGILTFETSMAGMAYSIKWQGLGEAVDGTDWQDGWGWGVYQVWEQVGEYGQNGVIQVDWRSDVLVVIEDVCTNAMVVNAAMTLYTDEG